MAKVQNKNDIIEILNKYGLSLDNTYKKESETFLLICDGVTVNEINFRDVKCVHFIGKTMWVDNASIEVEDVNEFSIYFTSIRLENDDKDCEIIAKVKKDFKLK